MANYMQCMVLFFLYIGIKTTLVDGDVLDVTCFNQYPVLDADNSEGPNSDQGNVLIGGYEGSMSLAATVDFNRAVDTNTGIGLPANSEIRTDTNNGLDRTRLLMPDPDADDPDGSDRIGVFQCVVDYKGEQTKINTFTMEKQAWILPEAVTTTVNIGESATLNVTTTLNETLLRWNKDSIPIPDTEGLTSLTFQNITVADAGIYECYKKDSRNGLSAYMSLIVRGCSAGMWGEDCSQYCTSCYNGGVCDESTGECICAPGFAGVHCEELKGSNCWGQDAEWICSSAGGADCHADKCKGRLMCLQDPFGCACPAGFKGRNCTESCDTGKFGRNCEQTCHCAGGSDECLWDTGDCTGGCETGWKGDNCQVPEPCPLGFYGEFCDRCPAAVISQAQATPGNEEVTLEWEDETSNCPVDYYTLQYELIKQDGCQNGDGTRSEAIQINSIATSYTVTGLEIYSMYAFYLSPYNDVGDGAELRFENVTTKEQRPEVFPANIESIVDGVDALTFMWDEIPCGNRSGEIIEYHYQLVNTATNVSLDDTATNTNVSITSLDPCTTYAFRVAATTNAGTGPYSMDITGDTDIAEPGQVRDLNITLIEPTELSLQWTLSNSNRCPIDGFYIEYELINEDNCNPIGEPVRVSRYFVTETNATIDGLVPFSVYNIYVIATNSAGNSTEEIIENVETAETVPAVPVENVRTGMSTTQSLSFEWDEISCGSRRGNIVIYEYKLYDDNNDLIKMDNVSVPLTNVTIGDLTPCSSYSFHVAPVTKEGYGPFADLVYSNTTVSVPNGVEQLTVTQPNAANLNITWLEPSDKPCPINGYFYRVELINIGQCEISETIVDEGFTISANVLLNDPEPYSTYIVYVFGENEAGNGTAANETIITEETFPEKSPYITSSDTSSRTLTYSWDEIPCGERGGDIIEYQYELRDDMDNLVRNGSVQYPNSTITIDDLIPCSSYNFKVQAATIVGPGPFTSERGDVTDTEAPEAVEMLEAFSTGSDSISVSWDEPTFNPCPIDQYYYSYELINLDQCQLVDPPQVITEGTTANKFLSLSGLETFSTYRVFIYGQNEAGDGQIRNQTTVTNSSVPEVAPVLVSADSVDPYTLQFVWEAIPCGNRSGTIMGYQFELEDNEQTIEEGVLLDNITGYVSSSLVPCTQHTFTLAALNENGNGPEVRQEIVTDVAEPDKVDNLTISPGLIATELNVSWSKPSTTPCDVDEYSVGYQLRNQDQCNTTNLPDRQIFDTTNTTFITVDDLLPYSTYDVFVTASNSAGDGTETNDTQTTAEIAPSKAPANVLNADKTEASLTFTWDEIQCGYRGGNVFEYFYQLYDVNDNIIAEDEVQSRTGLIMNLDPCVEYKFQVAGVTNAGTGVKSLPARVETDFAVPGPVQSLLSFPTLSPIELFIQWNQQILNACPTSVYQIEYELTNRDQCEEIIDPIRELDNNTTVTEALLSDLEPYSTYQVYITAINQAGLGELKSIQGVTNETVPSAPPQQVNYISSSESITVTWSKPPCGNRGGVIENYHYQFTDLSDGNEEVGDTAMESIEFTGLVPCRQYEFIVRADTYIGHGPDSDVLIMETKPEAPGKPTNLFASEKTETTILLEWTEPADQPCEIVQYKIVWQAIDKPYDDNFSGEPSKTMNTSATFYLVSDLEPSTTYQFEVSAFNLQYWSDGLAEITEAATEPAESLPTNVPLPELDTNPLKKSTKTITIPLPDIPSEYTYYYKYQIGVAPFGVSNRKRDVEEPNFGNCGSETYIAGEVDESQTEFVVGDEQTFLNGLYCNPKLKTDTAYDIYVGFASRLNDQEVGVVWPYPPYKQRTEREPLLWEWLAPLLVLLLIAVLVPLVFMIFTKSRKPRKEDKEGQFNKGFVNIELNTAQKTREQDKGAKPTVAPRPKVAARNETPKFPDPVKVNDLLDYVNDKKSGGKKWAFEDHYELVPDGQLHSWDVATNEKNIYKNRYYNIAYDNSRVVLDKLDGDPYSDYINANYIDGYKKPKKYIATQGPNSASIWDFWRMMWQENVQVIVMVTKCKEDGKVKCEQYWPEELNKSETYCDIVVSMVTEDIKPDVTIRLFEMNKMFDNEVRTVQQFHYTSWPDHGTPQYPTPLLNFVKLVKTATETTRDIPLVVHCSAGVGRTGTFIAIDSLLEQAKAENKVDVFKFVQEMRQKRVKMVQTCGQYDFIFDALVEEIVCGNTLMAAKEFHEKYKQLRAKDENTKQNGLEHEFENLKRLSKSPVSAAKRGGMSPVNVSKNRFPNMVPVDRCRPYLMTPGIDGSTNYINASFLDGHNRKDMFLTTQMPLHSTVGDLWRMLYDYNSYTVVMLNPLDNTDKTMAKYWPQKGVTFHGPLAVQFVAKTEVSSGIIYRTFRLTHKEKPKEPARIIRQYVYPDWPLDKEVPTNTKSILHLINDVQKWQEEQEDGPMGKPLTVHCIDGVGVSSTFCALASIVDRMKAEECIDVFQTVKRLRMNRFGAVSDVEQYSFLYAAVLEFIDSYSIYENFSHAEFEPIAK